VQLAHEVEAAQAWQLHISDDKIEGIAAGPGKSGVTPALNEDFMSLVSQQNGAGS